MFFAQSRRGGGGVHEVRRQTVTASLRKRKNRLESPKNAAIGTVRIGKHAMLLIRGRSRLVISTFCEN